MKNKSKKNPVRQKARRSAGRQRPAAGKPTKPVARWVTEGGRRLLVLQNAFCRVTLWPEMGGAIASYVRIGEWYPPLVSLSTAMLAWLGLFLRDGRIRALLPFRAASRQ